jgi:hypothetical protein
VAQQNRQRLCLLLGSQLDNDLHMRSVALSSGERNEISDLRLAQPGHSRLVDASSLKSESLRRHPHILNACYYSLFF